MDSAERRIASSVVSLDAYRPNCLSCVYGQVFNSHVPSPEDKLPYTDENYPERGVACEKRRKLQNRSSHVPEERLSIEAVVTGLHANTLDKAYVRPICQGDYKKKFLKD